MIKRLFDIIFSGFWLVVLFPFSIIFAIIIKVTSKGPVFYRAPRMGKNLKPFKIYKFRSMVANADKIGGPSTSKDDPRLTKIGAFLRRFKFDELPQLINVFKGEMSMVGPRPEVVDEIETYTDEQKKIFTVRPGITDYASLWDSHEEEILKGAVDPHQVYREKIKPTKLKLQLEYVYHHSFWIDIKIILKTIVAIFK